MPDHLPDPSPDTDAAAKERAASLIGQVISKRYRIDEVLAMGGMGAVYRGEHVHMRRRIAIKVLHPDTEQLPELVMRFEREAVAGAHIQHPNVASAIDFGEMEDGSYFLVLEYVRGVTLHEIIRRGALPVPRAILIARQLAGALEAAHAMDIVHRDVKPRNVMVAEAQGDLVKLIDFGLAKVRLDRLTAVAAEAERAARASAVPERLTGVGVIFGTLAYLAPEAALGMDMVDARSDLFALGLMVYEMLAGKHPFYSRDPIELFKQQCTARPPPIAEYAPGVVVAPEIEAVVRRLLEKPPHLRFGSGAEVVAALDEACAAAGITLTGPALPGGTAAATSVRPPPLAPPPAPVEESGKGLETTAPKGTEATETAAGVEVHTPLIGTGERAVDAEATEAAAGVEEPIEAPPAAERALPVESEPAPDSVVQTSRPALPPEPHEGRSKAPGRRRLGVVLALGAIAGVVFLMIVGRGGPPPEPQPVPAPQLPTETASPSVEPTPPSTAPEPSPSAASSAPEAAGSAAPVDAPPDAPAREALETAVKKKEWGKAADALLELAEREPGALRDRKVAIAARKVAIAIAPMDGGQADLVFNALARRFGTEGLDMLYELIEIRGRSAPALRAADLLRTPEIAARATPAVRIAFELRDAPCDKKLTLLDRAVAEGDERAVVVLDTVVKACFTQSRQVSDATKKLRAQLKN